MNIDEQFWKVIVGDILARFIGRVNNEQTRRELQVAIREVVLG